MKKIKKAKCDWCAKVKKLIYECPECGDEFCKECEEKLSSQCPSQAHEAPELEKKR